MPLKDSKYVQAPTIRVGTCSSAYLLCSSGQNLSLKGNRELLRSDGNFLSLGYTYTEEQLKNSPSAIATMGAVQTLISESISESGDAYLHDRVTIHNDANTLGADLTLDPAKGVFLSKKSSSDPTGSEKSVGMYWNATPNYCGSVVRSPLLVTAGTCALTLSASAVNITSSSSTAQFTGGSIRLTAPQGLLYTSSFATNWKCANSKYVPTVSIVHCLLAQSSGSTTPAEPSNNLNFFVESGGYNTDTNELCQNSSAAIALPPVQEQEKVLLKLSSCPNRITMRYALDGFDAGVDLRGNLFVYSTCGNHNGALVFGSPIDREVEAEQSANRTMFLAAEQAATLSAAQGTYHNSGDDGYEALVMRSVYPIAMQFVRDGNTYNMCLGSQDLTTVSVVHTLLGGIESKNYDSCINSLKQSVNDLQENKANISDLSAVADCASRIGTELGTTKQCVSALRICVNSLVTDISSLNSTTSRLQTDVTGLQTDVTILQSEVEELKKNADSEVTPSPSAATPVTIETNLGVQPTSGYQIWWPVESSNFSPVISSVTSTSAMFWMLHFGYPGKWRKIRTITFPSYMCAATDNSVGSYYVYLYGTVYYTDLSGEEHFIQDVCLWKSVDTLTLTKELSSVNQTVTMNMASSSYPLYFGYLVLRKQDSVQDTPFTGDFPKELPTSSSFMTNAFFADIMYPTKTIEGLSGYPEAFISYPYADTWKAYASYRWSFADNTYTKQSNTCVPVAVEYVDEEVAVPELSSSATINLGAGAANGYGTSTTYFTKSFILSGSHFTRKGRVDKITCGHKLGYDGSNPGSLYLCLYQTDPATGDIVLIGQSTNRITPVNVGNGAAMSVATQTWNFNKTFFEANSPIYIKVWNAKKTNTIGTDNPEVFSDSNFLPVFIWWYDLRGKDTARIAANPYASNIVKPSSTTVAASWEGSFYYSYAIE